MPILKSNGNGGSGGGGAAREPAVSLEQILTLDLTGIVVLAERAMRVEDVLNLRPGSIVEFPKSAEDFLDFQVNNRRIARGVTVKDGEKFGLEIREIGKPEDTVRALGQ